MTLIKLLRFMANKLKTSRKIINQTSFSEKFAKEYPQMRPINSVDSSCTTFAECRSIPLEIYHDILQNRRAKFVNGFWQKSLSSAIDLSKLKRKYILAGYDWPSVPLKTLSKFCEKNRTTYYHPEKIKRLEHVESCMNKMPELLKLYKQKVRWEIEQFEGKSFKSEQEIYLEALGTVTNEPRNWVEEKFRHNKLRKCRSRSKE